MKKVVKKKYSAAFNKNDFFNKVYQIAKNIPYCKVTIYGDIAEASGIRSAARIIV